MSSLLFAGNPSSHLRIPNTDAFDFGTGDFTIEWYQYQTDSNPFPRVFQVGNYPSTSIGVSIEGGTFYYWRNGSYVNAFISNYKNRWVHFAISRSSGVTKIFMDGVSILSVNDTTNFNGSNDLVVANESNPSNGAAFGGYLSYFSWVKGVALYTADFTIPTNYPSLTNDYILLLTASSFTGTLGNTVVNNGVSTIPQTPPGFGVVIPPTPPPPPPLRNLKSLFSDNSRVFYKPGSLASCGVGSVRNSSIKSRKI